MTEELFPPLSVLVVEDQQDTAQSTAELLTLSGHVVRVASCGADALAAARNEMPDVVLMDIGLPGMNGWEVVEQLRRLSPGKQPFVVAVTGYGGEADRWRSADAGIDLHLTKPADPSALTNLLSQVRAHLSARAADVRSKGT